MGWIEIVSRFLPHSKHIQTSHQAVDKDGHGTQDWKTAIEGTRINLNLGQETVFIQEDDKPATNPRNW